jgi:hypothetical protein
MNDFADTIEKRLPRPDDVVDDTAPDVDAPGQ